jgi:hypothetical protein
METLMIEVATDEEFNARIVRAAERGEPQPPGYFFDTEEARTTPINRSPPTKHASNSASRRGYFSSNGSPSSSCSAPRRRRSGRG